MLILVGESASGKSSIEKYLCDNYDYKKVISYTTRQPRKDEQDGVDYHFISNLEFAKLNSEGFFAEVGQYNNWFYGSSKEDCTNDKVAVLTPHGLRQLMKNKNLKIYSVYLNVPRRDRLIQILQRGDDIEEAYRRSLSDVGQFDGISDEVNFEIENFSYIRNIDELSEMINSQYQRWLKDNE